MSDAPQPLAGRIVLAFLSLSVSGAAAWFGLEHLHQPAPSVVLEDDSEAFGALLEERRGARGLPAEGPTSGVPGSTPEAPADPGAGHPSPTPDALPAVNTSGARPGRAAAPEPGPSGSWPPPLLREPVDEDMARNIFAMLRQDQNVYHPQAYYLRGAGMERKRRFDEHPNRRYLMRTNADHYFNDEEVGPPADVRIVVTGDSHIEGVCFNREAAPQLLAGMLGEELAPRTVEAFNAGVGGYQPYNYLGALERSLAIEPDVFVMIVYGGNDLSGMLRMERYFSGRGPMSLEPFPPRTLGKVTRNPEIRGQEVAQVLYFLNNPEDVQIACDTLASITREAERIAEEAGVQLVLAYLPPVLAGQPRLHAEWRAELARELDILEEDIDVSNRIADCWLGWMAREGMACVDLRPAFAAEDESLYWESDQHINLLGQRRVAEGLLPVVRSLVAP